MFPAVASDWTLDSNSSGGNAIGLPNNFSFVLFFDHTGLVDHRHVPKWTTIFGVIRQTVVRPNVILML